MDMIQYFGTHLITVLIYRGTVFRFSASLASDCASLTKNRNESNSATYW